MTSHDYAYANPVLAISIRNVMQHKHQRQVLAVSTNKNTPCKDMVIQSNLNESLRYFRHQPMGLSFTFHKSKSKTNISTETPAKSKLIPYGNENMPASSHDSVMTDNGNEQEELCGFGLMENIVL